MSHPTLRAYAATGSRLINLGQRGKAGPGGPSRVYFQMSGVDALYEQVTLAGASVTAALGDRPYGIWKYPLDAYEA